MHRRSRGDGTGLVETEGNEPDTPKKLGLVARRGRQRRSRIPDKSDISFRYNNENYSTYNLFFLPERWFLS